jgi:hypothetical protein
VRGLSGGGRIVSSGELLLLLSASNLSGDGVRPIPGEDSRVPGPMSRSGVARLDPGGGSRGKSGSGDIERRSLRATSCGSGRTGVGEDRSSSCDRAPVAVGVEPHKLSLRSIGDESALRSGPKDGGGVGRCISR